MPRTAAGARTAQVCSLVGRANEAGGSQGASQALELELSKGVVQLLSASHPHTHITLGMQRAFRRSACGWDQCGPKPAAQHLIIIQSSYLDVMKFQIKKENRQKRENRKPFSGRQQTSKQPPKVQLHFSTFPNFHVPFEFAQTAPTSKCLGWAGLIWVRLDLSGGCLDVGL